MAGVGDLTESSTRCGHVSPKLVAAAAASAAPAPRVFQPHALQVITGGPSQKFGHPIEAMAEFAGVAKSVGATVVGEFLMQLPSQAFPRVPRANPISVHRAVHMAWRRDEGGACIALILRQPLSTAPLPLSPPHPQVSTPTWGLVSMTPPTGPGWGSPFSGFYRPPLQTVSAQLTLGIARPLLCNYTPPSSRRSRVCRRGV
jgi:hypothetical protein